jgi:poly-D-alanine transfer protein DltD
MKKIILGVVIVAAVVIGVVVAWPSQQSANLHPEGGAVSNTQTQTLKATQNHGMPQAVSPQPAASVVSNR